MQKLLLILILLFLFPLVSLSQKGKQPKNYILIGLLDSKTGFSAIGYTRSILQNKNNELFIGFGTMLALNTVVAGYKKYLFRSFIDGYSVISIQNIFGLAGDSDAACLSIGLEKKIWKVLFINAGGNIHVIEDESFLDGNVLAFPFLNINIRF
tara:strand:- start:195 stop:653 length:459 start_codon:yes stop_codon:yes gene_type:complete